MTIAVTGATGQLGRLVLDELLTSQEPDSLVAIVRDAAKAAELVARGVQVRVADYSDPAALEAALTGVDRLLLVSGSEVGSRVAQHGNVIDAARAAGVGFIAYTSVLAADTTELILAPGDAVQARLADGTADMTVVATDTSRPRPTRVP